MPPYDGLHNNDTTITGIMIYGYCETFTTRGGINAFSPGGLNSTSWIVAIFRRRYLFTKWTG